MIIATIKSLVLRSMSRRVIMCKMHLTSSLIIPTTIVQVYYRTSLQRGGHWKRLRMPCLVLDHGLTINTLRVGWRIVVFAGECNPSALSKDKIVESLKWIGLFAWTGCFRGRLCGEPCWNCCYCCLSSSWFCGALRYLRRSLSLVLVALLVRHLMRSVGILWWNESGVSHRNWPVEWRSSGSLYSFLMTASLLVCVFWLRVILRVMLPFHTRSSVVGRTVNQSDVEWIVASQ